MKKIKELIYFIMKLIKIRVSPDFVPNRSNLAQSFFFFSYTVHIYNTSKEVIQLLSRYWRITDGNGNSEEIYGPGVIGKMPVLKPKESFDYTSFCSLVTPLGFMEGYYRMQDSKGIEFDVPVETFQLTASEFLN